MSSLNGHAARLNGHNHTGGSAQSRSSPGLRVLMTADSVGGVWTFVVELLRAYETGGIEVVLANLGGPLPPARRRMLDGLSNVTCFDRECRLEWMRDPWADVERTGRWLLGVAEEFSPSIVHLNSYSHAALPWNAPVVVTAHSCVLSWWTATRRREIPACHGEYRSRVGAGLACADLLTAPTAALLGQLHAHYAVGGDSRVIPNGCDPAMFQPAAKRPVILTAGRLWDEAKNVALLARVAPSLRWPVAVAGDAVHPCSGERHEAPASLRCLGALSREALAGEMRHASIYVSPALYEPFGLAVLEAALSGCALVLSDIPSFREVWGDAAVYCPPDDDDCWIAALNALASRPALRERLAEAARHRAGRYTARRMAQAYGKAYKELARGVRPRLEEEVLA